MFLKLGCAWIFTLLWVSPCRRLFALRNLKGPLGPADLVNHPYRQPSVYLPLSLVGPTKPTLPRLSQYAAP